MEPPPAPRYSDDQPPLPDSPPVPPPHAAPVRVAAETPRPVKPIGAGVLAANAVEGYMDNQESELRAELHGSGVVVQRSGDLLLVNIRDNLLFGSDSNSLSTRGEDLLDRVGYVVRKFDSSLLVVDGYTDTTGTAAKKLTLSQKRADAVAKQLAIDGVEQKRLAAKGFGDEILKIPTGPNVAEPRNRRIEIRISPLVKA
jgi:outer membrane protein OmpA-like peptidoglycan-associated protein